eukprot:TRINITY_DN1019_c0_g3_i3.p1 TRINITY_DN1019_c0_g3~~TRINITY_DN1019_c0_g3_i3.p1  ORF type:complete len:226 (-),score=-22.57 TRINITY_DN1019_c0_g3_i3:8-685(-)
MNRSRMCKYSCDSFCYVCGHFIPLKAKKHSLNGCFTAKQAYHAYFGMQVGQQDKVWAPKVLCSTCRRNLEGWYKGEKRSMPFAIPRIWREPRNHINDCFFCVLDMGKKKKRSAGIQPFVYPNIPSSSAPIPHNGSDLLIPSPPTSSKALDMLELPSNFGKDDVEFPTLSERTVHFPTQEDVNDLIREMSLTKENAELLTSRLKEWNILDKRKSLREKRKVKQWIN